ncbi:deoxyribodipyrimidine photo-lyase [Filimonas lacunae]|uniref:Deoxyribodipyrimidine photo-lyase n=1 Tax=Filimonas lacunae TaxID=477680 RepID=A0A173M9I4_9BACT|nr:deoxyribodipyrimidine photo-lyase [Filimonas lacunae]BAV04179.1 deoxyribodipyrimidine photolyase [Filimonas lacunae]SIT14561.1 deoxyribodipyrimidine photo-lyase [Filimonas lacunae]
MKAKVNIAWFRRDLRLTDNAALYHALKSSRPVVPIFVFDTNILNELPAADKRITFIYDVLEEMQEQLKALGSSLEVYHGTPEEVFTALLKKYDIGHVFTNHDYEQYAIDRDEAIGILLKQHGAALHTYKDQVIFERNEVVKDDGTPYTVFTPYSRKWKSALTPFYLSSYPAKKYYDNFYQQKAYALPTLKSMGFERVDIDFPGKQVKSALIEHYKDTRDFPGIKGTSHLGIHLRFGTISIRQLARKAQEKSEVFLNELIWRDFYHMILAQFAHVRAGESFRQDYDRIPWRNNEKEFEKWCAGQTGYPIVDAGMRELNTTGFMHNRVRMITASFLTKHLLIDWRWGEAYFAEKLLDYDYAANNGGWQWAAGCGCDAAPYFRVFSPARQTEKFDKELTYIKKWVPELEGFEYPAPMVVHEDARKRALATYGKVLKKG